MADWIKGRDRTATNTLLDGVEREFDKDNSFTVKVLTKVKGLATHSHV